MSKKTIDNDIGYLTAKLEEIHDDVKELKTVVELLKADHHSRIGRNRALFTMVGVLSSVVSWVVTYVLKIVH